MHALPATDRLAGCRYALKCWADYKKTAAESSEHLPIAQASMQAQNIWGLDPDACQPAHDLMKDCLGIGCHCSDGASRALSATDSAWIQNGYRNVSIAISRQPTFPNAFLRSGWGLDTGHCTEKVSMPGFYHAEDVEHVCGHGDCCLAGLTESWPRSKSLGQDGCGGAVEHIPETINMHSL